MTPAQTLVALLQFAAVAMPEAYEAIKKLVAAFKARHPAIAGPPPADHEKAIDADIDAQIEVLEDEPTPTTDRSP